MRVVFIYIQTYNFQFYLWPPYVIGQAIYIFILSFVLLFFFHRLISAVAYWMHVYHTSFDTWCDPGANLECRSETCCARLAGNAGPKKSPKSRHLGTIAQVCRAISSQLRHVSTIGKKRAKQQYLLHMSAQHGELQHTSG